MRIKKILQNSLAVTGMIILILDSKTALAGARLGIDLCIKAIIPSLFPFFILSNYLLYSLPGNSRFSSDIIHKHCRISDASGSAILFGFLGGYPAGAQIISSSYRSNILNKESAEYLLQFCSNAGPAFLFGIVSQSFPDLHYIWALWIIHISSALLVALVYFKKAAVSSASPKIHPVPITDILNTALHVMASVCGWVVVFKVLIHFLEKWLFWYFPKEITVFLSGLLELSNGCLMLSEISDIRIRFVICSVLLSFGGLCVTMQTSSVIGTLPLKTYLRGKMTQAIFSLLLSISIVYKIHAMIALILPFFLFCLYRIQKNSRFSTVLHV